MKNIVFVVLLFTISGYSVITFERTFGGTGDDNANSIRQTTDGGYIAGCRSDSVAADSSSQIYTFMTMKKLNSYGEYEWDKKVTGITIEDMPNEGYSAIETKDGGYTVAGCLVGLNHAFHTLIYVLKTDSSGVKQWDYRFGYDSSVSSVAYDMIQTEDNGYAVVGDNFGMIAFVKLDSEGKEEWINYDLGPGQARSLIQTEDKGFVFTGYDDEHLILVKTDSLGNEVWNKNYGGMISQGYSVKQSSDGGFVILGKTGQMDYADVAWLIKTDANGELEWSKVYGSIGGNIPNYIGQSIDLSSDGGYILTGYSYMYSIAQAWLIKVDSEGNEIWEKTFGGAGDDRPSFVQQTLDGGYILAGYTDSFGAGGKDMWIIKTDENGTEIESPFLPQTTELHQNYPNPFNPVTTIRYALSQAGNVELNVFNLNGQLVKELVKGKMEKGIHKTEFKAGDLTSGIYIYNLKVDDKVVQSRKMIMLK
ncbi:TPA: hypothetical protein DCR49_01990 [Candidatus Delongbacteria bacterium]|nr:hypothetical protein [Candidatus Delongbacteria bacterium]